MRHCTREPKTDLMGMTQNTSEFSLPSALRPFGQFIAQSLRRLQLSAISARLSFNPEETLIIFSSGRGGSTWLTDIVRAIPKTATIWEPLSVGVTPEFDRIGFDWDQYIPLEADWPEAREAFDKLFRGQLMTWPNTFYERQHTRLKSYCEADQLIVKFTGANALAPWLCHQFAFKKKPILLLRHPMATIASRYRHGAWDKQSDHFIFPSARYTDLNDRHHVYLSELSDLHTVHAAKWCMQHLPTFEALKAKQIEAHVVYYEEVVLDRQKELNRLFSEWNIAPPGDIAKRSEAASVTTRKGSPLSGHEQISNWRNQFSQKEIGEMQAVLDYFEIEVYSKLSDRPLVEF